MYLPIKNKIKVYLSIFNSNKKIYRHYFKAKNITIASIQHSSLKVIIKEGSILKHLLFIFLKNTCMDWDAIDS